MYNTLSLDQYDQIYVVMYTLIINIFPVNDSLDQSQDSQVLLENNQNMWFKLCMTGNEKYLWVSILLCVYIQAC